MTANVSTSEMLSRQHILDDLDEFISGCQSRVTDMLEVLGWTPEHFMQDRSRCVCPYNKSHRMPSHCIVSHAPLCSLISEGYTKSEAKAILEDRSYFYDNASCVYQVKLDLDTMNSWLWNHHVENHSVFYGYKKVPQTAVEEQVLMSREDRRAVAEYVILRARAANRLKEVGRDELLVSENLADLIKKENAEKHDLDPVEEMAALRDYRRRRQTYRAKNVHITKKSHTEIMREVINNQMEMYTQSLIDEQDLERDARNPEFKIPTRNELGFTYPMENVKHEHRSRSRTPNSSSRSEKRSRSRSRINSSAKELEPKHRSKSPSAQRSGSRQRSMQRSRSPQRSRSLSRQRSQSTERKSHKSKKKKKHKAHSRSKSRDRGHKKHKKHKHKRSSKSPEIQ